MTLSKSSLMSRGVRTRAVQMLVGLVVGGVVGMLVARAGEDGRFGDLSQLSWSGVGGLLLALMLIASGLFAAAVSFSGRMTARTLDPDGGDAPRPGQTIFLRQQGVILVLASLMMGAPVLAGLLFDPLPRPLAAAIMAGLVALFLTQTAFNLAAWTRADEMMRRMIAEVGAVCFWVLQGLFFLWAAAEVLGLAPKLSSWDLMVVLMAFYLVTSSVLAVRRGFA